MPNVEWISSLDYTGFTDGMKRIQQSIAETAATVDRAGGNIEAMLRRIAGLAGVTLSVDAVKGFLNKVAETRAYFQDIESSMKVFLGNEKKAAEFTNKLKDYAYYNMFEFSDLANASKQMIAYGHSVDTIIPRLDQLSNVARGTNAPLMEMVNSYNKAKNLGGLDGKDLQSWASKGLVIKDILKDMGETAVGNKVSFEQLNKVLDHVTGEGGMFHNLMGEQMSNISAEQGQLQDNLASMYNEIGEKYQDTIVKWYKMNSEIVDNFVGSTSVIMDAGAGAADFLIDHYKEIGSVMLRLIAVYGEWRATLVAMNAIKGAQQTFLKDEEIKLLNEAIENEKKGYEELLDMKERAKNADLAEAVAKKKLTKEQAELVAAKREELEALQVSKETLSVDREINELKRMKLDEDLQDKVSTEQLTLAQAQEVQQRREVLRSLDEEIKKRKEAKLAKIDEQIDMNTADIDEAKAYMAHNEERLGLLDKGIEKYDKRIEKAEKLGETEEVINQLKEKRQAIIDKEIALQDENISKQTAIEALEQKNKELTQQSLDIQWRYATSDQRISLLNQQKGLLDSQLVTAKQDAVVKKEAYEKVLQARLAEEEKLRVLKEELATQQQMNNSSPNVEGFQDTSGLQARIDAQQAVVDTMNDATHASEENNLATMAGEAAEKALNIQEQINSLENQKNTITQSMNARAKAGNMAATNALSVSERIHNASLAAGTIASRIFSVAVNQVKTAIKGLGAAIMTNPLGIVVGAITMALPWIMNLIGGTEEATEGEKKYGEAASKAAQEATSLVAVINDVNTASKVHKDAMGELERMYDDYGIKLDESIMKGDNEAAKVKEMTEKHEELVAVLKLEAIERQKANDISDAAKEYEETEVEARKKLTKDLSDEFSNSAKSQMANLIDDDLIQKARELENIRQIKIKEEAEAAERERRMTNLAPIEAEYNERLNQLIEGVNVYTKALGVSESAQVNARQQIKKYIAALVEGKEEQDRTTRAANEAANAMLDMSDSQIEAARKILYAKMSAEELKEELKKLPSAIPIDVNITYNETNPMPEVLKDYTSKQWKARGATYLALAAKHKNGAKIYDTETKTTRYMSQKQLMEESARASNQSISVKAKEDEKKAKENTPKGSGGGRSRANEAERRAKEEANRKAAEKEEQLRHNAEMLKIEQEGERARSDARIAAIINDAERERAEREEQFRRQKEDIEAKQAEIYKTIYEERKKAFERSNKDSKYENTEAGAAGWSEEAMKGTLTASEQEEFSKRNAPLLAEMDKLKAEEKRYLADRRKAEQDAMTAYLKDYGTAEQQRLAIAEEYDRKIAESRTEGERNTLVAQKEQALQAHDLGQQQKTMDMESLFNNLGQMSLDKLNQAKEELRGMLSAQNLGMDDYKTIAEQIDKVEDAIVAKQKQKKGLLGALIPGETTVQRLKRQQAEAEEQVKTATEKVVELQKQLAGQKLGIFSMLSAGGANYKGDISAANRSAIMESARNAGFSPEKLEELEKAMDGLVVTTDNLNNAEENANEANKNVKKKSDLLGEALKDVRGRVGEFAESLQTLNANIQSLPALMDSLGLGNTGAGQAVSSVASAANNAMGAMADFASENYVGAAVKAVGAVKDVAAVFGPDNTAKMQAKIDELNSHSDALAMAMKSLQKAFENSYGINAMENAEKQRQLLESQQRDAQMAMVYEARKHGANRSTLNASVNDNQGWQDAMKIVSQILGKNVRESGNDFLQLSASEMQKIIDYDNGELWNKILAEYRKEGGKGGRSDQLADMLQSYVDNFGSAFDDLDNMVNEKLTNTTKENVLDDFKQSLYDLAGGSEDVFDNIEQNWQQMINQMVIDNLILKDVQDDIEKWYERLAQLQKDRNNGIIDDKAYKDALEALKGDYTDIMKGAQQTVNDFTEWGIIKPLEEAAEDVSTAFGNLRDTFKDSLLDMESDADAFRKNLQRTLYEDLIEKNVFDVPFTINGMTFDDFEAYSKDWNERYAKAVADGDTAALDALIEELVEARKITAAAAESYREALKNLEETAKDTTFKDMGGSWVSMLMGMDSDAETWGKEIGRTMAQKIIEQMILADTMQPLLNTLQDNFNRAMGESSSWEEVLADEGVNAALADIEKAYPALQETVTAIMDRLGLSVEEEAKQGFSDLRSLMTSALLDTEGDMKTFGKNMAETMLKQMLDTMIDSKYKKRMDAISKEWAEALDAADPARIDGVKQQVMDLYEEVGKDSEIKQLTEDIKALAEGVDDTTTPFDNLRSSYHSWLMDMTKDTKDFTEDLNKMLADAFVDEFVMGKAMDDIIEKYKGQFKSIRDDATLSKEERARQMKALGGLIAEEAEGLKAETKEVLSWFGLSNNVEDQGAAMNMAESATYDQFELYLGIATAQQINGEQQLSIQQQILATLQSMNGITSPGGETVKEISSRMRTANEYLLSIRDSNKAILDTMSRKLDVINANLSRL